MSVSVPAVDSMFRAPAEGPGSEVAAAASPNSYVDAIRTGLDANAQEQSEIQKPFALAGSL